jgi:hypothetical protein
MDHQPGRDYDSFVVRLWREASTGNLLRAEIEHVQSGTVDARSGVSWDWIRERLHASLEHPVNEEGAVT